MEISHTTVVDAPIARLWDLTLDIASLPEVTPTVTAVERLDDGPVVVGSRAVLGQPGLGRRTWVVEVVDEPHRFAWATRLAGGRMVGMHDLEPTADGRTRLTLRVVLEGGGAGLLGLLGRRSIGRALAAEAAGFARAATATADAT